ncbi:unnamed protein product [Prorocentrum cordatum]|uniref:Uncharacterized protein n=1 Tax=Prorocentrum cordatum TaxID=2364126 RepID=A0ABN9SM00_9DINO|nr:unnamed protein product [Polarella glacialis]
MAPCSGQRRESGLEGRAGSDGRRSAALVLSAPPPHAHSVPPRPRGERCHSGQKGATWSRASEIVAARDIEEGEEITISFLGPQERSAAARARLFRQQHLVEIVQPPGAPSSIALEARPATVPACWRTWRRSSTVWAAPPPDQPPPLRSSLACWPSSAARPRGCTRGTWCFAGCDAPWRVRRALRWRPPPTWRWRSRWCAPAGRSARRSCCSCRARTWTSRRPRTTSLRGWRRRWRRTAPGCSRSSPRRTGTSPPPPRLRRPAVGRPWTSPAGLRDPVVRGPTPSAPPVAAAAAAPPAAATAPPAGAEDWSIFD